MSAIKLPVEASPDRLSRWQVSDCEGNPIAMFLNPDHALQIVLALNRHDGLVSTLKVIAGSKGQMTACDVRRIAQNLLAKLQHESKP